MKQPTPRLTSLFVFTKIQPKNNKKLKKDRLIFKLN
jgi:hypothetical protein